MEINYHINGGEENKGNFKKKRSRGRHVIRVVLFMFRRRKQSTKSFNANGFWRRVVDSVRHLKPDEITILPSLNITILPSLVDGDDNIDRGEELSETVEVFTATSSFSSPGISVYGSAKSLREMDCLDEKDDDDDGGDDDDNDDDDGDEMIDEKAEEFIERFYEQMRMQNQAYTQRHKG